VMLRFVFGQSRGGVSSSAGFVKRAVILFFLIDDGFITNGYKYHVAEFVSCTLLGVIRFEIIF
jgi:hypothetical protein